MNKQTRATPFAIDTVLVALGGLTGVIAAGGAELSVWHTVLSGMVGFFMSSTFIGILPRYAVSPGQLLIPDDHRRSERSVAVHALLFTGSVTMTILFAVGCAAFAITQIPRFIRIARPAVQQPARTSATA